MWRVDDNGIAYWYNDQGYVMTTTASTTTGAWGTITTWSEVGMLDEPIYPSGEWDFTPKPKCIFDEK